MSSEARDHLVCVLQMEGDQRARENGPENPATSRPRQKQTSDTVHVAVRTSVLDRKNVNEMNSMVKPELPAHVNLRDVRDWQR